MDITIRPEIVAAIGIATGALIIAFLWMLVWFVKHLTSFAKALKAHSDVNAAQARELLAINESRRVEREQCDKARAEVVTQLQAERGEFERRIATARAEAELANGQLAAELVKVKGDLAQTKHALAELQRERERLESRVSTLEEEGRKKDQQIALLKSALDASEQDRNRLVEKLDALTAQLNGKADKPHEPGEAAPERNEPNEKPAQEG